MQRERIIYLVIMLTAGILLTSFLRDGTDLIPFESRKYWIDKTHKTDTYPVLFAGDSRVYRGLSPAEFEKYYPGMKGLNLGYSAHGYRKEYMDFLEKRLDTLSPDPLIVMGISAAPFCQNAFKASNFMWEYKGKRKETILEYRYLYFSIETFVPFNLKERLFGNKVRKDSINYQQVYHSDGWVESHWLTTDTTFYNDWYSKIFVDNPFEKEKTGEFLDRIEEWTNRGIHVVGFRTPASFALQMREDTISDFPLDSFIIEFQRKGGIWLEIDREKYLTFDGNHLDYLSALELSKDLALAIRELMTEEAEK